jgi:hypothetical protein
MIFQDPRLKSGKFAVEPGHIGCPADGPVVQSIGIFAMVVAFS